MKQFKLKAINLLLCVLTFTAASCKDDEKLSFNANEQESVGLTVSSKGIFFRILLEHLWRIGLVQIKYKFWQSGRDTGNYPFR